jgi:hypothetical protein
MRKKQRRNGDFYEKRHGYFNIFKKGHRLHWCPSKNAFGIFVAPHYIASSFLCHKKGHRPRWCPSKKLRFLLV